MTTAIVEGKEVKVGDHVCFKCDIEQAGQIIQIKKVSNGVVLVLENKNGFQGHYIGGKTVTEEYVEDCWL